MSTTTTMPVRDYRIIMFEELGFSKGEACALADARGLDGFDLYWGDVKKLLDQGCSASLILAIFL